MESNVRLVKQDYLPLTGLNYACSASLVSKRVSCKIRETEPLNASSSLFLF